MQTSGTFPQLSDGVRKTVTGAAPPPKAKPAPATPKASSNPHRRGGHAKHAGKGQ